MRHSFHSFSLETCLVALGILVAASQCSNYTPYFFERDNIGFPSLLDCSRNSFATVDLINSRRITVFIAAEHSKVH